MVHWIHWSSQKKCVLWKKTEILKKVKKLAFFYEWFIEVHKKSADFGTKVDVWPMFFSILIVKNEECNHKMRKMQVYKKMKNWRVKLKKSVFYEKKMEFWKKWKNFRIVLSFFKKCDFLESSYFVSVVRMFCWNYILESNIFSQAVKFDSKFNLPRRFL